MSNLVERLRGGGPSDHGPKSGDLMLVAADEIERLRAALSEIADPDQWYCEANDLRLIARRALDEDLGGRRRKPNA